MEIILIYVLVVALFASLPEILDICLAYRLQNKTRNLLIEKASLEKLELDELKEFIKECGNSPPGIQGLTRGTMALTVIVILGIAVFHILVKGVSGDSSQNSDINLQIVNNILSMLAGLLAAITGFYFGGRAAEKKEEEKK